MANNVDVKDAAGASKTVKTTDNASVHTPHTNVDAIAAGDNNIGNVDVLSSPVKKVYRAIETALTFCDSGGSAVITLINMLPGVGRVSARYDRGAGSLPRLYRWRAVIQFETAAALGELVEIHVFESDGTYMDGVLGTSDAAMTADKKRNSHFIGVVVADTVSTATNIIASGLCLITDRYISVGVWNGSAADNLENTSNACLIILTPVPDEIQ